jgi:hypothetical protein
VRLTLARLAQRVGVALAQADVLDLAVVLELLERRDALLERRVRVDAVQVVQVGVGAEALLALLDVLGNVLGLVGDLEAGARLGSAELV